MQGGNSTRTTPEARRSPVFDSKAAMVEKGIPSFHSTYFYINKKNLIAVVVWKMGFGGSMLGLLRAHKILIN